jgi:DNA repair protein RadC
MAQTSMFPTQTHQKLKLLPVRERPAYRVQNDPAGCNLVELLAAVVGGQDQIEIAEALLKHFGGIRGLVNATTYEMTDQISGIGNSTAVRLKAALALAHRVLEPEEKRPKVRCPEDTFDILSPILSHREQEVFLVVALNTRNEVLDVIEVVHGSVNSAQIRIAEVFRPAIRRNATALIVAHNHPSGDPSPSPDDVAITKVLVETGQQLDLQVLDHLILGQGERFVSLKRRGLGFE